MVSSTVILFPRVCLLAHKAPSKTFSEPEHQDLAIHVPYKVNSLVGLIAVEQIVAGEFVACLKAPRCTGVMPEMAQRSL